MVPSFSHSLVTAQITELIGESSLEKVPWKKFLGKSSLFDFYGFQLSRVVLVVILFEELPLEIGTLLKPKPLLVKYYLTRLQSFSPFSRGEGDQLKSDI